jgi:hypothetical protein
MKYRVYAIILLFIMVLSISKPIIPYIQYAIFKDYIAKTLCINKDKPKSCCQGKCFLEKELKKSTETNDTEGKSSNKKISNKEVNEFLVFHNSIPEATEIKLFRGISPETVIESRIVYGIFVPPKA